MDNHLLLRSCSIGLGMRRDSLEGTRAAPSMAHLPKVRNDRVAQSRAAIHEFRPLTIACTVRVHRPRAGGHTDRIVRRWLVNSGYRQS